MIRDATPRDYAAIRAVLPHAFRADEEANLVEQLRADGDVLVELVAASDIAIQGHILYSPLAIERGRRNASRGGAGAGFGAAGVSEQGDRRRIDPRGQCAVR